MINKHRRELFVSAVDAINALGDHAPSRAAALAGIEAGLQQEVAEKQASIAKIERWQAEKYSHIRHVNLLSAEAFVLESMSLVLYANNGTTVSHMALASAEKKWDEYRTYRDANEEAIDREEEEQMSIAESREAAAFEENAHGIDDYETPAFGR